MCSYPRTHQHATRVIRYTWPPRTERVRCSGPPVSGPPVAVREQLVQRTLTAQASSSQVLLKVVNNIHKHYRPQPTHLSIQHTHKRYASCPGWARSTTGPDSPSNTQALSNSNSLPAVVLGSAHRSMMSCSSLPAALCKWHKTWRMKPKYVAPRDLTLVLP